MMYKSFFLKKGVSAINNDFVKTVPGMSLRMPGIMSGRTEMVSGLHSLQMKATK